jgi:hypothetical protein
MIIKKVVLRKALNAWRIAYDKLSLCAMLYALCLLLSTLFIAGCAQTKAGCAQAKNYVGVSHGHLNVGMKQHFGQGANKKNFYNIDKDTVIAVGDSKESVILSIGYPDKCERSLEGYEVWVYNAKRLKLFFDKEYLKEWRVF